MYMRISRHHGPTGNPRGRPVSVPLDLPEQIIAWFKAHVDPKTGLVKPCWKQMAREFGVSRTTIARRMVEVKRMVKVESIDVTPDPINRPYITRVYYRINFP